MPHPPAFSRLVIAVFLILAVLAVGGPGTALAAVIQVPGDQPDIQSAMTAAALFGDEIVLADGTYTGAANRGILFDKHVTIRSASGDPRLCIIDCQNLDRAFTFDGVISAAVLDGVTIANGLANEGGAIRILGSASPVIINCRFTGNVVNGSAGGGIAVMAGSSPFITNCTFSGNATSGIAVTGAGVFVSGNSTPLITNCTFSGNDGWDASAIQSEGGSTVTTVVNCIVWGNDPGQTGVDIQDRGGSVTTVTYSNIQGGFAGTGNINLNPGFIDPDGADNVFGTPDDDPRIGRFSPCIDAGDNTAAGLSGVTTDYLGGARFVDDGQVTDTGNGTAPIVDMGPYERQSDSFKVEINVPGDAATIQAAIDMAQLGDEVVIADGTYTGAGNRDLLVTKDITIRSASGDPAGCIIDGQGAARGITFDGATAGATLTGLTITNGNAVDGGGIRITDSSPFIIGCRILANIGTGTGGGGLAIDNGSSPHILNCTFIDNDASGIGTMGGGIFVVGASTPEIVNCSFTGNDAWDGTAVVSSGAGTQTNIFNCIVWGNEPGNSGNPVLNIYDSVICVGWSNIQGGFGGTGNINSNPVFMDLELRLAPISPCIDAGKDSVVIVETDYDGNQRIHDGDGDLTATVDMGAFEYGSSPLVTGIGDAVRPRIPFAAWPNPTRSSSLVRFELPAAGPVSLAIFDVEGRRVAILVDGVREAGPHTASWNGLDASGKPTAAGVYFARLRWGTENAVRRIIRVP